MSQEQLVTLDVRQQMFPHKPRPSGAPTTEDGHHASEDHETKPDNIDTLEVPAIRVWSPYSTLESTPKPQELSVSVPDIESPAQGFTSDCLNIPMTEQSASPDSRLRHLSTEVLRDEASIMSPEASSENSTFIQNEQLSPDDNMMSDNESPPAYKGTEATSPPFKPIQQKGILKNPITPKRESHTNESTPKDNSLDMPEVLKQYYDMDQPQANQQQLPKPSARKYSEREESLVNGYPSYIADALTHAYMKLGRIPFTPESKRLWLKTFVVFAVFLVLAGAMAMIVTLTVRNVSKKPKVLEIDRAKWGPEFPVPLVLRQLRYREELGMRGTERYTAVSYQLLQYVDSVCEHSQDKTLLNSYGYAYVHSFGEHDGHVTANVTVVLKKHFTLLGVVVKYRNLLEGASSGWKLA